MRLPLPRHQASPSQKLCAAGSGMHPYTAHHLAALAGAILLVAIAALAGPWDEKDWTKWSEGTCKKILSESPWATSDGKIQLVSALPVRLAYARLAQIRHHYTKMDPRDRTNLDQQIQLSLQADYSDRIVVCVLGMRPYDPDYSYLELRPTPPVADQSAVLILDDRRQIPPSRFTDLGGGSYLTEQYEIVFPRFLDGQPIIRPSDKNLRIRLRKDDLVYSLEVSKMIFHGKFEY